jgi:hypothetical protein
VRQQRDTSSFCITNTLSLDPTPFCIGTSKSCADKKKPCWFCSDCLRFQRLHRGKKRMRWTRGRRRTALILLTFMNFWLTVEETMKKFSKNLSCLISVAGTHCACLGADTNISTLCRSQPIPGQALDLVHRKKHALQITQFLPGHEKKKHGAKQGDYHTHLVCGVCIRF